MKIKKKLPGILGDIILLITAVFCVLPFIYMLLMSLKSTVNAYDFSISLSEIYAGAVRLKSLRRIISFGIC